MSEQATPTPKRRLGRGLDALLRSDATDTAAPRSVHPLDAPSAAETPNRLIEIALAEVQPNPEQPRKEFRPDDLKALSDSIRTHGLLHPIVVENRNGQWVLIAGERRMRAAQLAGLTHLPALTRPASESERQDLELALTENVVRANLTPLEEAMAYSRLSDTFGLTHEAIALRLGKSRPLVTNTIRLLNLSAPVQRAVADGRLSTGHAKALLAITDPQRQERAARVVEQEEMSVRDTEKYVQKLLAPPVQKEPRKPSELSADDQAVQRGFEQAVGSAVKLERRGKGGRLVIEFATNEDLDALYTRLGGPPL